MLTAVNRRHSVSLDKFCEEISSQIEDEAGATLMYRRLRDNAKRYCPKENRDLCHAILESISVDERKHNELLKAIKKACCEP